MNKKQKSKASKETTQDTSEITKEDLKEIKQMISNEKEFYQQIGLSTITEMDTKEPT
ncbi:MAG: hypothetical protein HWE27_07770 [Gammaproteobacteria bacterium]|nr:hypothetical protein [Gammaproteobacteria bacterium]